MFCALLVSATAAEAGGRGHMFDRMDRDQDGLITGPEFAMAREHMFERVDEDGDGYLTREEIAMRRDGHSDDRRSEHAGRRFDRIDQDHDERISRQEFVAGAGRWLHRADADGGRGAQA
jgi:Ca2+-binding EF-hand superfamily protein